MEKIILDKESTNYDYEEVIEQLDSLKAATTYEGDEVLRAVVGLIWSLDGEGATFEATLHDNARLEITEDEWGDIDFKLSYVSPRTYIVDLGDGEEMEFYNESALKEGILARF